GATGSPARPPVHYGGGEAQASDRQPGGKYDPAGMPASQQGDRDPGEPRSGGRVRRQPMLRAEQLVDGDQSGKGTAATYGEHDNSRHPDTRGSGRQGRGAVAGIP